ncbi:MAG TPA: fluoride efflux transporter CrcB [Caulobacteraceae bacterium]
MIRLLLVAAGGAIGSAARFGLGAAVQRWRPESGWPWGTLCANVLGGLLMGALVGWLALRGGADQERLRLLLGVGVLGGFTTFSAFTLETVLMIEQRRLPAASAYIALSVALSVAALVAGLWLARRAFA